MGFLRRCVNKEVSALVFLSSVTAVQILTYKKWLILVYYWEGA